MTAVIAEACRVFSFYFVNWIWSSLCRICHYNIHPGVPSPSCCNHLHPRNLAADWTFCMALTFSTQTTSPKDGIYKCYYACFSMFICKAEKIKHVFQYLNNCEKIVFLLLNKSVEPYKLSTVKLPIYKDCTLKHVYQNTRGGT